MNGADAWHLLAALGTIAIAGVASAALILLLRPLLARYALARPNARSSHVVPTPQGGGIAVMIAALFAVGIAIIQRPGVDLGELTPVLAAAVLLAVVGAVDDVTSTPPLPRLLMQFLAAAAVVSALPGDLRIVPAVPLIAERAVLVVAGVWAVNLTNFMDGIDWMTVVEVVPITAGAAVLALTGALPPSALVIALALLGAIIGFAPFNRPVAKLFLGDVGSLPIGLLLFWLMVLLAGRGYPVAALLLPLYYLADATITLLKRAARGENVTRAHRSHFYQLATARGWSVPQVIARVVAVNVLLAALALASAATYSLPLRLAALAVGAGVVGWLLAWMQRGKPYPGGQRPLLG
jgi:UDP-N-acetylmuramyl pentapeptide phosphotransferase/UDP-N-acetylglucosamine-1-phosphate transferase